MKISVSRRLVWASANCERRDSYSPIKKLFELNENFREGHNKKLQSLLCLIKCSKSLICSIKNYPVNFSLKFSSYSIWRNHNLAEIRQMLTVATSIAFLTNIGVVKFLRWRSGCLCSRCSTRILLLRNRK